MTTRVLVLAALALLAAGCRTPSGEPPPLATRIEAHVAPDFAERGIVDVAVARPSGSQISAAFRTGLREALQRELIERAYSPLDPAYVDRMARGPDRHAPRLASLVTDVRRASDGGVVVSGSAELRSASPDSPAYRIEVEGYSVPPVAGTEEPDGGREAGRRFGEALLSRLPPRGSR